MSGPSTALSRDERRGAAPQQIDRVRSLAETAELLSIGLPSLRVLIAKGKGPRVIQLSARRLGVKDSDREAWVEARARISAQVAAHA